ncbi:NRT2 ribosyltransferase, partial [Aphelocoma coerulescens]|nr:NRT2 ribosyltransferase [Aphelocoma coerulescens]
WPLPSMAPLAHTLALLAMAVATAAIEVVPLDMAQNSFDDQYQGGGPAMAAALPALKRSEFQQNKNFARAWAKATAEWQKKMSSVSYLPSDQAIALMAYTMDDLHEEFNAAVREAGSSPREYRDNFHFKGLHFLLSSALAALRDIQGRQCRCVIQAVSGVRFEAQPRDTVRLGQFLPLSHCGGNDHGGMDTVLQVDTCHSVDVRDFSSDPSKKQVLIQPFETFKVTFVVRDGDKVQIILNSTGNHSNSNCEWLRGDGTGTTWGDR